MKPEDIEMKRCLQTINNIKLNFHNIRDSRVRIIFRKLPGTARARWLPFSGFYFLIDPSKTIKMDKQILRGLFAHEISHLEQFSEQQFLIRLINSVRADLVPHISFMMSEKEIEFIEKDADRRAIKLGFGKELLALRRFLYLSYSKKQLKSLKKYYLSPEEIERNF